MPRKESARMRELREAKEAELENEQEVLVDEIPEIARLRESLGDGQFTVRIARKGDDGLFEKFPSMPLESFDPDSIAAKYGGGVYKFDVIDSDGTYVKRFTASYSKLIKPRSDAPAEAPKSFLASPEFAIIQQMQNQSAQMMAAMQQQMMTMMGEVVKAVSSKPAGPDFKEMILALKGLKDLGGGDVASEMVKGALSMAGKFMEMGRDSASSQDPESSIMNKLIEFLPGVLSKIAEPKAAALPAPKPANPPPAPVVPEVKAPEPEPAKSEAFKKYPNVSLILRQIAPKLLELAQANSDVEASAKELVSVIPEAYDVEVDAFVQDGMAVDYLMELYPPLSIHVGWIKRFIKAVDAEFQDEPAEPVAVAS